MEVIIAAKAAAGFANGFANSLKQSQQAKAQAQMYQQQAELYRRNARNLRRTGAMNEDVMRSQQRTSLAQGAAAAGEAGISTSPTYIASLATASGALEQNILNNRFEVESQAENYLYQAAIADENARQMKKKGKNRYFNALMSGNASALGSI